MVAGAGLVATQRHRAVIVPFLDKLYKARASTSRFGLYISPRADKLPPDIQQHDDPFLPYMRVIHAATRDLVCAYVFDFAAYLALGAAGVVALERSVGLVVGKHITVLDGPFASERYNAIWDEAAFGVDAITVALDVPLSEFRIRVDRQAFVTTENTAQEARYSMTQGIFTLGTDIIPLLPFDLLVRARSLTFEETLRKIAKSHVLS